MDVKHDVATGERAEVAIVEPTPDHRWAAVDAVPPDLHALPGSAVAVPAVASPSSAASSEARVAASCEQRCVSEAEAKAAIEMFGNDQLRALAQSLGGSGIGRRWALITFCVARRIGGPARLAAGSGERG